MRKAVIKKKICVCGHSHMGLVGDLGEHEDELGYDFLPECCECDCENYKPMRAKK